MRRQNLAKLGLSRALIWSLVVSGALLRVPPLPASPSPEPPRAGAEVNLRDIEKIATDIQFADLCGDMVGNSRKFEACRKKLTVFKSLSLWIDSDFLVAKGEKISPKHLDILHGFPVADAEAPVPADAEASRLAVIGVIAGWCPLGGGATAKTFEDLAKTECLSSLPTLAEMGFTKIDRLGADIQAIHDTYDRHKDTTWTVKVGGASSGQAASVRLFRFGIQLKRAPQLPGELILEKGTVLQPIDQGDRAKVYQSMVLCEEVKLRFDGKGTSQPITLYGFCSNPNLVVPPEGVTWQITVLGSREAQEKKCDPEVMVGVRKENEKKPTSLFNRTLLTPCRPFRSRPECQVDFDEWLKINHKGKTYGPLHDDGRCVIEMMPNKDRWGLYCDLG